MPANAYFRLRDKVNITNYRVRPGRHSKDFEPKFFGAVHNNSALKRILIAAPNAKNELMHYNRMTHFRERELEQCGSHIETFVKVPAKQPKRIQTPPVPKPSLHLSMASSSVASATKIRRG